MAEDPKRSEYEVTERAGKRVAGHVVEKGKVLLLTEAEAEHGLAEGTIVLKGKQISEAFAKDTKAIARMRGEAQAFRGRGAPPEDDAPEAAKPAAEPVPPKPAAGAQA